MTPAETYHNDPNRLLTAEEAALFLALQPETLAKWRETGRVELPFVKLSRNAVRYRYGDVMTFIGDRMAFSTVQARHRELGARRPAAGARFNRV